MSLRIICIVVIFHYLLLTQATVYLKTSKLECKPSPKYFHNYSCYLKAINRYKTLGFMETYIKNSLTNVSANVALYARNYANVYKPYLVNFTSNLCEFMARKRSGLYLNTLMQILKTYTNVNHSCPYKDYLIAKNLHIDSKIITYLPIPQNFYKFVLTFYEGYPLDYMGTVSFYIELIEANVALYARNYANVYKPYLVNFTSNLCEFMARKRSGLYGNTLMQILKTYTNVNHTCPLKGYLIAKNVYIDTKSIPYAPVPQNFYKFVLTFYEGYPLDYIGTVSFYIELIEVK